MLISLYLFVQALYWCSEARVYPKIIGGNDVDITEAPYHVSLHRKGHFQCGGTLIARDKVLTLAHCIMYPDDIPSYYYVRAGSSFIDHDGDVYPIEKFERHPKFDYLNGFAYDVAILHLSTKVALSDKVAIIEITREEVDDDENAQITGWGLALDPDFDYPTQLQGLQVQTVNAGKCAKDLNMTISSQMMCTGVSEGEKGFCDGDYGSPLVHNGNFTGLALLPFYCGLHPYTSQVYMKVSAFRDWIDEAIKNHPTSN